MSGDVSRLIQDPSSGQLSLKFKKVSEPLFFNLPPMTSTFGHRSIIIKTAKIISWPEDASWIRRSPLTNVSPDGKFHLFLIF